MNSKAWKEGTHKYQDQSKDEILNTWQNENRAGTLLHALLESNMNKIEDNNEIYFEEEEVNLEKID